MKLVVKPLSLACALALGMAFSSTVPTSAFAEPAHATASADQPTMQTAPKLHSAMRGLWHGHLVATHDYALAVHAGNKAHENSAADAVVANAKDLANAVAGFYGKDAGDGLFKLLAGHWGGVKAMTDNAKSGDAAGEKKALEASLTNAADIAKFLAGANPNWTEGALNGALAMHVNDHKLQVDQMMSNAPAAEQAKSWQGMQKHMDMIADVLADGIAKQFPDKAN